MSSLMAPHAFIVPLGPFSHLDSGHSDRGMETMTEAASGCCHSGASVILGGLSVQRPNLLTCQWLLRWPLLLHRLLRMLLVILLQLPHLSRATGLKRRAF